MSPTQSGLALLPAIIGIFTTSIGAGQMISRTGKYKIYPIVGAAVLVAALLLLSTIGTHTPLWQVGIYEFLLGAGLGFAMQTIVTAIQNAVDFRDLGAATASATFFRQMGGAIGAAVFGAVLSARLTHYLTEAVPGAGVVADVNDVQAIQRLTEPIRSRVLDAFSSAIDDVFLVGVPFTVLAFVVALFLTEVPLRTGAAPVRAPVNAREDGDDQAASAGVSSTDAVR
jgi:MFS family permease